VVQTSSSSCPVEISSAIVRDSHYMCRVRTSERLPKFESVVNFQCADIPPSGTSSAGRRDPDYLWTPSQRQSLLSLASEALSLGHRPLSYTARQPARPATMARVYADVNTKMPRSYWDYDSVAISWGILESYEVVRKIGKDGVRLQARILR
jgi:hypothetical protein